MSEIFHYDCKSRIRLPFQTLSEEFVNKVQCNENKIENINLETVNEIEKQLNYLQNLSKNDENIFKICKFVSHFFNNHKRDYCDIYMEIENNFSCNSQIRPIDFKNFYLSKTNRKSNSLLSIVDIKMEINESDSLDKLANNIDLNKNSMVNSSNKRFFSQPSVIIYKELGTNTENNFENQETQTAENIVDKSGDLTEKFLFFRGQTKEVLNFITVLMGKSKILESKCSEAYEKLAVATGKLKGHVEKMSVEKVDFGTETCEGWLMDWDRMISDSLELKEVKNQLELANQKLEEAELTMSLMKADNKDQFEMIEALTKTNAELTAEKNALMAETTETREMNEFMNAEHQSVIAQMEQVLEDCKALNAINDDKVSKLKAEYRREHTRLVLERHDMDFKFQHEQMNNSCDKQEVGFLQKRLDKFQKDVAGYPVFQEDPNKELVELKKKVTLLEDKRIAHANEKQKWFGHKARLIEEVHKGNDQLNQKIAMLKEHYVDIESDYKSIKRRFEQFVCCFDELRKINLDFDNRHPDKYVESFRAILSKYDL